MRNLVLRLCGLVCLVLAAACGDMPTQPDLTADVATMDGPAYNTGCVVSSGVCILEPVVVDGGGGSDPGCDMWWTPSCGTCMASTIGDDMQILSDCPGGGGFGGGSGGLGGPGGGGGSGQGTPTPPTVEGPGAFLACVTTLLGVLGSTAMMEPLGHNVYEAREEYASAKRMYDAVMANNPTLEMELLYEHRVEVARSSYRDAIRDYALGAGTTVLAVGFAVGACSPGLILPTP